MLFPPFQKFQHIGPSRQEYRASGRRPVILLFLHYIGNRRSFSRGLQRPASPGAGFYAYLPAAPLSRNALLPPSFCAVAAHFWGTPFSFFHSIYKFMMHIVVPRAAQLGYAPDFWISPDGVGGKGRPYPYMIFENLKALEVSGVKNAVKVGDTVSDIQEGVSAGVWSVGVVEGSSVLGLSQGEYEALTPEERRAACRRAEETFRAAGAHFVLNNLSQLPELIHMLG